MEEFICEIYLEEQNSGPPDYTVKLPFVPTAGMVLSGVNDVPSRFYLEIIEVEWHCVSRRFTLATARRPTLRKHTRCPRA